MKHSTTANQALFDDEAGKELFAGVELHIDEFIHIVNYDESSVSFGLSQDGEGLIT